jgi:hypothetical protein
MPPPKVEAIAKCKQNGLRAGIPFIEKGHGFVNRFLPGYGFHSGFSDNDCFGLNAVYETTPYMSRNFKAHQAPDQIIGCVRK